MYDLLVIGGGINGAGIAADAAGRGLKVALVEQRDLASATSSWSSKLIHGGLRYLEHYEFRLVREALAERDVLLKKAPHIIDPLQFILPHHPGMRPTWMLRAGLMLYDNLNFPLKKSSLPRSSALDFQHWPGNPLLSRFKKGFTYSDCFVDDSRLVTLNGLHAQQKGADIFTYSECTAATFIDGMWKLEVSAQHPSQTSRTLFGKVLVNAAGPWVQSFIEQRMQRRSPKNIRLIKGSHILVPSLHSGPEAFILQNDDQRVVFVIPYRGMSLVGTTDRVHSGPPETVAIDDYEIEYLLKTVNDYFQSKRTRADIIANYSGVRPLCDDESNDPSAITRDYTLALENQPGPLLSVFGGKLTTYRKLAESAMLKLEQFFPSMGPAWTATETLPGGDLPPEAVTQKIEHQYPWINKDTRRRYVKQFGTRALDLLQGMTTIEDLGDLLFADAYTAEVCFLRDTEFAKTADDILWRRTKLGYALPKDEDACRLIKDKIEALLTT